MDGSTSLHCGLCTTLRPGGHNRPCAELAVLPRVGLFCGSLLPSVCPRLWPRGPVSDPTGLPASPWSLFCSDHFRRCPELMDPFTLSPLPALPLPRPFLGSPFDPPPRLQQERLSPRGPSCPLSRGWGPALCPHDAPNPPTVAPRLSACWSDRPVCLIARPERAPSSAPSELTSRFMSTSRWRDRREEGPTAGPRPVGLQPGCLAAGDSLPADGAARHVHGAAAGGE